MPLCAAEAAVATSHPLAAATGLHTLRRGGTAVDAAAIALTILQPYHGAAAAALASYAERTGGLLTAADLAEHASTCHRQGPGCVARARHPGQGGAG